ncbi:MAG TPA: fibronectin type III domain-containing protein [Mycobacteriales bacterium]|nr:fibronectin type III domain-containing protein [Mycobacteriales bacterium]
MTPGSFAFLLSADRGFSHRIHLADGAGQALRRLTNTRASGRPTYSPDGDQLVFPGPLTDDSDGRYCLYMVGADGGNLRRITTPRVADADPAWSPDGKTIAFVRDPTGAMDPTSWRLMTMPAAGGGQVEKVPTPGAREPAWSPDGRRLAFAAGGKLYVVESDGTGLAVLVNGGVRSPAWSPDGLTIAFTQRLSADRSRLSTVASVGGAVTVRADLGRQIEDPAYGVDGSTIFCLVYSGQGWDGRRDTSIWQVPTSGSPAPVVQLALPAVRLAHHPDPPPGPVTGLVATEVTQRTVQLQWTPPADPDFTVADVRRLVGTEAPQGAAEGTLVYRGRTPDALITDLEPSTAYSFSVFARDRGGNAAPPASLQVTTLPTGVPSPPMHVEAVPGRGSARVSWVAPVNDGGRPLLGYSVLLADRGQMTAVGPDARSVVVDDLVEGESYVFSVIARTDFGPSVPTAADPVVPDAGVVAGTYTPLSPQRLIDTRTPPVPVSSGTPVVVPVDGRAGIPPQGAVAVTLTLLATDASGSGFLSAYPAGGTPPVASTLNFTARQTVANLDVVRLGPSGVALAVGGATAHVVADVAGYYVDRRGPAGGRLNALAPARLVDTRRAGGTGLGPQESLVVDVIGNAGVPASGVGSVVLVVTAVAPTAATYLTVHPSDVERPLASVLNAARGGTAAVLVIARLSRDGRIKVFNNAGQTHLVVDVLGYHTALASEPGEVYTPLTPARLLDTRTGLGGPQGTVDAEGVVTLTVRGRAGVPAAARTVLLNVTATQPTQATHLTVYPADRRPPQASVLNVVRDQTRANLVLAKLSPDGQVAIRNAAGSVHLIADVRGYYSA